MTDIAAPPSPAPVPSPQLAREKFGTQVGKPFASRLGQSVARWEPVDARARAPIDLDHVAEIAAHAMGFIDATSGFLSSLARDPVSLSVKFVWSIGDGPVLHSSLRSTKTRIEREHYSPNDYPLFDNTAFRYIVQHWPEERVYACGDLRADWAAGEYENTHDNWFSLYNSTAVAAFPRPSAKSVLIGFLCADALVADLDDPSVKTVLEVASEHLYNVIGALYGRVKSGPPSAANHKALLPQCGWTVANGAVSLAHPSQQARFQEMLSALDGAYRLSPSPDDTVRSSAGMRIQRALRPAFEARIMTKTAEETALQSASSSFHRNAERLRSLDDAPDLTDEEIDEILEEMKREDPSLKGLKRKQ